MTPTDWPTDFSGKDAGADAFAADATYADGHADARRSRLRQGGSPMFWLLLMMSMAIFAPCVVLPVWRDYEAVALTEQIEAAQAAQDREEVERLRRHIDALRGDPQVVARLAKRELKYIEPGMKTVPVGRAPDQPAPAEPIETRPVRPPAAAARLTGLYPAWDHDTLFVHEPTRTLLLALATGLLLAAILWVRPGGDVRRRPTDRHATSQR